MFKSLSNWLDDRTGYKALMHEALEEPIPGGALAKRVLTPMPVALEIDGAPHPSGAYSLLCCSVVPDLGLRMRVNYRAAERLDEHAR